MKIRYTVGDFTKPLGTFPRVILNAVNLNGEWLGDYSLSISKAFPKARKEFLRWFRESRNKCSKLPFESGEVQIIDVTRQRGWIFNRKVDETPTWVANIIAVDGTGKALRNPIRYAGLKIGLSRAALFAQSMGAGIHMPKIGCQRHEGGRWEIIKELVESEVLSQNVSVTIYDVQ